MVELDEPALPLMPLEALPLVPEEPLAGGDPPAGRSAAPPDVPAALPEVGEPGVLAAVFIFTWPDASLQCVAAETLPPGGVVAGCAAAPITPAPTTVADNRRVFNIGALLGLLPLTECK